MPSCGSQVLLCSLPVRFDTYRGCGHLCKYCFVTRKYNINKIKKDETSIALKNFISGLRTEETKWCDWNIPLHWGGMSDPFQPVEREYRNSYECLKVLAQTKYPVVISTKGNIIAEPEYLELLKQCNVVLQISLVAPIFDKLEPGAPTFEERIKVIEKVSKYVKRVILRVQPYVLEAKPHILKNLERYKAIGVYGLTLEGIKSIKKVQGMERLGADFVYPYSIIKSHFLEIKDKANRMGLKVFSAENRLRKFGDSLNCCGTEGLNGFIANTNNLSYIYHKNEDVKVTNSMCKKGTAGCFDALFQESGIKNVISNKSFNELMLKFKNDTRTQQTLGMRGV